MCGTKWGQYRTFLMIQKLFIPDKKRDYEWRNQTKNRVEQIRIRVRGEVLEYWANFPIGQGYEKY